MSYRYSLVVPLVLAFAGAAAGCNDSKQNAPQSTDMSVPEAIELVLSYLVESGWVEPNLS